jgi:CRP-like cAMP-binding protein
MNKVTLEEGDYLFRVGEYGGAFIVQSGEVALKGLGRDIIIKEGDIVGEVALTNRSYVADACALTHVEAVELTRADILAISRVPNEAEALVEALLDKVTKLTQALLERPDA